MNNDNQHQGRMVLPEGDSTYDLHLDKREIKLLEEVERRQREAGFDWINIGPFTPKDVNWMYGAGLITRPANDHGFLPVMRLSALGELVLAFARGKLHMTVPSIPPSTDLIDTNAVATDQLIDSDLDTIDTR